MATTQSISRLYSLQTIDHSRIAKRIDAEDLRELVAAEARIGSPAKESPGSEEGGATVTQRIAIYARVSTLHGQNPEMQRAELREYAGQRACYPSCSARAVRHSCKCRANQTTLEPQRITLQCWHLSRGP
jgi:DNA invertase Pin-like site-specific DNA recombinase